VGYLQLEGTEKPLPGFALHAVALDWLSPTQFFRWRG